ncbi:MAG: ABC transporter permease, partial [Bacillota bacterium]
GMILAAVVASFMPAWVAMRIKPLDAMAPLGQPTRARRALMWAGLGLLLLTMDPLIVFTPIVPREWAFYAHFGVGLPTLFLGFFLLAPAVVWMVERSLGRVVAASMWLNDALLRQQLTGSLWRAAGTAAALMVGLAILVVMQVQGTTLLSGWRLPDKFPDVFIVSPIGLTQSQQKVLETSPGVKAGQVLPIAISSPKLGMQLFSIGKTSYLPDATMFFGIDPDRASQMIEFEYYDGNAEDAMRKLKQGRHVIVTNEFKQLKGIKVGDKLPLKTPMSGTVEYTVAAVVWSPGLDVIVSAFDMGRQLEQRTVASVCGSLEDAKRDFGIDRISLFAVNLESGVQKESLAATLTDRVDQAPSKAATQSAAGGIFTRGLGVAQLRKALGKYGFLVGDVRHIKYEIQQSFKRMLLLLSSVALAAIVVASLGVTNTIMASIRSRQWQFGILRSVGVTRWQLLRLILAEALLLGLAGSVLGLGAGFLMSLDANGVTRLVVGYGPAMVVPWDIIGVGVGIIVAVALLASLWPAISAARQQPLNLLQWGRAAA